MPFEQGFFTIRETSRVFRSTFHYCLALPGGAPYTVIRNCMPKARVIRITVAKLGLPFADSAL